MWRQLATLAQGTLCFMPCRLLRAPGFRLLRSSRLALLSALWLAIVAPAIAAERIERFDAVIEVGANGELSVSETISVQAEGQQIQRGIYRDFPLRFEDAEGRSRRVGFELRAVTRNGAPEPHFVRSNDRGLRIYIGDENTLLPAGRHTYRLQYSSTRQIRYLPGHVELFWNVTGNEWALPIAAASATIRLPGNASPLRWTGYTGTTGARGTDWRAELGADGALGIVSTRVLAPGEGLSVVAEIPAGVVAPPSGLQALRHAVLDYRRYLLTGLGLLGVLAFYLVAWRAVGRDPPEGVTIALFHPPEGISPGLAAYVHQWGWRSGWREFTAAAVALAVKGLLVFEGSADEPTLVRTKAPAPEAEASTRSPALPAGERALLAWLERSDGRVRIDRANGPGVASALASFKAAIEKENRHRFFRRNRGYFFAGLALTLATVAAILYFADMSEGETALLGLAWVVCAVAGSMLVRIVRGLLAGRRLRTIIIVSINVAALAWLGFMAMSLYGPGTGLSLPAGFGRSLLDLLLENGFPFVLVGGFALLNGLFYYLLRAPTVAGRQVMDQLEGFRLYLEMAESARLNLADAPAITTERFERLLPYAIALGVEKPWSEAFEAAFARTHPDQDLRSSYRPTWRGGAHWQGRSFANSLSGVVAATQGSFASAIPPPKSSSSGFSGGGGSGGGGGGGGGGGW